MSKPIGNISLKGIDSVFRSTVTPMSEESIMEIPLTDLYPPEFHPFNVVDDESMSRLVKSIEQYGVREPGIARPRQDGGYELLCGNRRKRACELSETSTMPVIIRELDDDNAAIIMVDSNLEQRESLLFSEKAWAYRVKLEALNHKGVKGDGLSVDVLVEQTGESKNQIFRLVRLTELVPALLDKVDSKKLAFNPAVELSYLSRKEQALVLDAMAKYEVKPSLSQAVRLKKMQKDGELTADMIDTVFSEEKKSSKESGKINSFKEYFPSDYSQKQMNDVIIRLLTEWKAGVKHG
ncbi:MAG: ParB/RepB/Spo0J family partition protein [Oscillospiraceae bacterium]|nr:ParB/RepB/Spo0J family partition protein [Oscillospiraceae bacterium]